MLRCSPVVGALGREYEPDCHLTVIGRQVLLSDLYVPAEFAGEIALVHIEAHMPAALGAQESLRLGIENMGGLGAARRLRRRRLRNDRGRCGGSTHLSSQHR